MSRYRQCSVCALKNIGERHICKRCGAQITDELVSGDPDIRSQKLVRLILTAVVVLVPAFFLVVVCRFLLDEDRPPIGDPGLVSREVTVHNSASVPLLVSDGSGYKSTPKKSKLTPGEKGKVEVIQYPATARTEKASFCINVETIAFQRVLHQCRTTKELQDATWSWDIAPSIP